MVKRREPLAYASEPPVKMQVRILPLDPNKRNNTAVVYWLGHLTFTQVKTDRNRSAVPN